MSAHHGASRSPETRDKLAQALKAAWADPEKRQRMCSAVSGGMKAAWADPATRHRMHAAIRAGRLVQFTAEMDATIRTMRADGHSFDQIADRVGVCPETLKRRMRELGMLP